MNELTKLRRAANARWWVTLQRLELQGIIRDQLEQDLIDRLEEDQLSYYLPIRFTAHQ